MPLSCDAQSASSSFLSCELLSGSAIVKAPNRTGHNSLEISMKMSIR